MISPARYREAILGQAAGIVSIFPVALHKKGMPSGAQLAGGHNFFQVTTPNAARAAPSRQAPSALSMRNLTP